VYIPVSTTRVVFINFKLFGNLPRLGNITIGAQTSTILNSRIIQANIFMIVYDPCDKFISVTFLIFSSSPCQSEGTSKANAVEGVQSAKVTVPEMVAPGKEEPVEKEAK